MFRGRGRCLLLLLLLAALSGCSSTFLYNRLDWLIAWYVEGYVDLTRGQNRQFKTLLQPLLDWHREDELENYRQLVDRIEADLSRPLAAATVRGWTEEATLALERLEARALPLVFEFGDSLSDAQMREFVDNLWKRQEKLEEKYGERDDERYARDGFENFEDNLREFLGRLTDEQTRRLREAGTSLQRFDDLWLAERRLWIEFLEDVLLRREEGWREVLREAIARRWENRSPAYRAAYAHNREAINAAVADVFNARTDRQSAHLRREIAGIRRDLTKLINPVR